jgi:acyl carrier protein
MNNRDWPTDRHELLARLAADYGVSPERIEATQPWRAYRDPADSLAVVELIMGLEEELRGGADS